MQSPLLFHRIFLGFGPNLVQQTPRNPFKRVSKRNRLASHRAPCSLLFWDVPAASPCSTCHRFSLLSPGGPGRGWVFWGIRIHPTGPHGAFYFVLCGLLFVFLHRQDFLASPNCFLTDVGMFFLPGGKLYPCPHTPASLERAEHPTKPSTPPSWPPQHSTGGFPITRFLQSSPAIRNM